MPRVLVEFASVTYDVPQLLSFDDWVGMMQDTDMSAGTKVRSFMSLETSATACRMILPVSWVLDKSISDARQIMQTCIYILENSGRVEHGVTIALTPSLTISIDTTEQTFEFACRDKSALLCWTFSFQNNRDLLEQVMTFLLESCMLLIETHNQSPLDASPMAASPLAASPRHTSPFAASPVAASPFAASPRHTSPLAASPLAASPVAASPFAASPRHTSPVAASPRHTSPVAASPVAASPQQDSPRETDALIQYIMDILSTYERVFVADLERETSLARSVVYDVLGQLFEHNVINIVSVEYEVHELSPQIDTFLQMQDEANIDELKSEFGKDVTDQMIAYLVKEGLVLVNEGVAYKLKDSPACQRILRFCQSRHSDKDLRQLLTKGQVVIRRQTMQAIERAQ